MPPDTPPDAGSRPPRLLRTTVVALLCAVAWWLPVSAGPRTGLTFDEMAHLVGGWTYWERSDYRLHNENGNLPQRLAGWALIGQVPQPAGVDPAAWARSDVWLVGRQVLHGSGLSLDEALWKARASIALFGPAIVLLVHAIVRRRLGWWAATTAAALAALSPTLAANSSLATSDAALAFFLLWASDRWWRWLQEPTFRRLGWSLLATAGLAVAKHSAVLFAPIAALLAVVGWTTLHRPPQLSRARWLAAAAGRTVAVGIAHAAAAMIAIWAAYGFRFQPSPPGSDPPVRYYKQWDTLIETAGTAGSVVAFARDLKLLPEPYLHGFAYVLAASRARSAFFAGEIRADGWALFFPTSFLVKSSLPELLGLLAGVAALGLRARSAIGRSHLLSLAPVGAIVLIYGASSLTSRLNIGHRHILPLYPAVFIAGGALAAGAPPRRQLLGAATLLVAGQAATAAAAWPHLLAWFNPIAGGPHHAYRLFVDSSLDWGQGLPELARIWGPPDDRPRFLAYFGSDEPGRYGIRATALPRSYDFLESRPAYRLTGGSYAISATMLQQVTLPFSGPWTTDRESIFHQFAAILDATPRADVPRILSPIDIPAAAKSTLQLTADTHDLMRFARLCLLLLAGEPARSAGNSILLYEVSDEEARIVEDGTLAALHAAMVRRSNRTRIAAGQAEGP